MPRLPFIRSCLLLFAAIGIGCGSDSDSSAGNAAGAANDAAVESSVDDAKADLNLPETAPCFPPNKMCDDTCVEPDDPNFGCTADSCSPCAAATNATTGCVNNECQIACDDQWADCDNDPANGCETSLTTEQNCETCGMVCALANAEVSCATGTCELTGCSDGWDDCNGNLADGCETSLRTLDNCGACGVVCSVPSGSPTCVTGVCQVDG